MVLQELKVCDQYYMYWLLNAILIASEKNLSVKENLVIKILTYKKSIRNINIFLSFKIN